MQFIAEILLKVVLNTTTLTPVTYIVIFYLCTNQIFTGINFHEILVKIAWLHSGGNRSNRRKPLTCCNHIMLYRVHLAWAGFKLATLVVISTDCIGSCKSNYYTITTTTAPTCNKFRIAVSVKSNYVYCTTSKFISL
jgi:hypothetical protein